MCSKCYQRLRRATMPAGKRLEARRLSNLQSYGLSPDNFDQLWQAQSGCCGVCSRALVMGGRFNASVFVDHDHKTGRVRGLLCMRCNTVLGFLEDSALLCLAAVNYLDKEPTRFVARAWKGTDKRESRGAIRKASESLKKL